MADIAVSLVEEVVKKVAEYLVAPVCRHCGYLIFSNRNVRQLKKELDKMDLERQQVQHLIEEAQRNMKPIEPKVEKWMEDVKTVTNQGGNVMEEAKTVNTKADALLLDHDGRGNKTCFCKWFPNPKTRYRLGKEASRMIKDIPELIGRGQFQKVHFENPPPGLVTGSLGVNSLADGGDDAVQEQTARGQLEKVDFKNPSPGLVGSAPDVNSLARAGRDIISGSRSPIFQGIMNALDDEKCKVIGIYGVGGVGKTRLLREVEKELRKERRPFHMIVKAEELQIADVDKIQRQIADFLDLNLEGKQSQQGRRDLLCQRLQQDPNEKVLIILDDLWTELDLEAVGIPSPDESGKCKLLLTSRFKDVLIQMKCAPSIFHLEGLKDEEAFRLFEKTVGNRLKDEEEVRALAPEVVNKLAGLPLLINSVATTLIDSHLSEWKYASRNIDVRKMETIVKLSYNRLNEDAKTLFRVCGLVGGTIEVELLLGIGMSLGLFEEFNSTIEDARHKLNTMVNSLRSACLLEDGGDDEEYVTIHDLYSEVVVSTQLGAEDSLVMNSNYGSWPKKKLEKCWAISLADVGRDRLAELTKCQFPKLEILMLSQQRDWTWRSERHDDARDCCGRLDFKYMKELRVLYLRSMHIAPLPSSIEILENLRSLYLDNCDVGNVVILGELKALEILSFKGSMISTLPKETGGLTKLRSLNLNRCSNLKIIERGAFKGLFNLEELLMEGTFREWMEVELCKAWLAELKSLTKLTALEISKIPSPAVLLKDGDLPFENLNRFCIDIGGNVGGDEAWERGSWNRTMVRYERTMYLELQGCNSILSKKWVQNTIQATQFLCLKTLTESKESAHELCIQGFSQLKHLIIEYCPSIKYIAGSSNDHRHHPLSAFTSLESLHLKYLRNLEKICHGPIDLKCFGKLKAVTVEWCARLKSICCYSNIQGLVHLEMIQIFRCNSMQAIITYDARNVETIADDGIVELPHVRRLSLRCLPRMTSFSIGAKGALDQVSFPRLETLEMWDLPKLKKICQAECFSKLQDVNVAYCPQLKHLLCLLDKQRLMHLEKITVEHCDSMETIIIYDARIVEVAADDIVELPNVRSLELRYLQNMTSFCTNTDGAPIQLNLPCLENLSLFSVGSLRKIWYSGVSESSFCKLVSLSLYHCADIVNIFPSTAIGVLPNLKEFSVVNCSSLESLVDCGSLDSNTKQVMSFPSLRSLHIGDCPNVVAFARSPLNERPLSEMVEENDESAQSFFNEMVTFSNITELKIKGIRCEELWNNQIPRDSFCELEFLSLVGCDKLRHIAPSCMWKRLQCCLEILQVISCPLIEVIYEGDGTDTESGKLRSLIMHDLNSLKHIWRSDGQPNAPFPNLRKVGAVRCSHLETLFASFTEKFLGQMEELVAESCEDMKLIAGREEGEGAISREITFLELTALGLLELPQFRSFLPEKYSLNFPSLQELNQKSCGNEPDKNLGHWDHYKRRRTNTYYGKQEFSPWM